MSVEYVTYTNTAVPGYAIRWQRGSAELLLMSKRHGYQSLVFARVQLSGRSVDDAVADQWKAWGAAS